MEPVIKIRTEFQVPMAGWLPPPQYWLAPKAEKKQSFCMGLQKCCIHQLLQGKLYKISMSTARPLCTKTSDLETRVMNANRFKLGFLLMSNLIRWTQHVSKIAPLAHAFKLASLPGLSRCKIHVQYVAFREQIIQRGWMYNSRGATEYSIGIWLARWDRELFSMCVCQSFHSQNRAANP